MTARQRARSTFGTDHVPRLPRVYVPRPRLWARLDEATQAAVTALVGPGGAGKTLGVSGWLRHTGRAESTAWVRADSTWTAARLFAVLGSVAADSDGPRLVVVDDAHRLPLATVRAIDRRLDQDPETMRLLLVSRWDVPLTRLAPELLGHLTLLRGELLRLDEEESAALVAAHVHSSSPEIVQAISGRAHGWCAAVVLTARAVAVAHDPLETARRYAEGGTSVADRVASEAFATLQPRQRHLLLCVANEPVVTPGLAVHLSHDSHAGTVLAELESMGLLVTRLSAHEDPRPRARTEADDDQVRYAIHPLLSEVVRRQIAAGGADVVRASATVRRAVGLDVAGGVVDLTFRRLVGIGDLPGAARLLADEGTHLLLRGHGEGIRSFVHQHPSAIEVNPASWFAVALERWSVNDVAAAKPWLDRMLTDPMPATTTTDLQIACARLMRSRLGLEPMAAAVRHARQSLADDEGSTTDALTPILLCELAITETWLGMSTEAEADLGAALRLSRSQDLPVLTVAAQSHLALMEFVNGHESACLEIARNVLEVVADQPWQATYTVGRAHLARDLAQLCDVPSILSAPAAAAGSQIPLHEADPTSGFWARMRRARMELARGSVSSAERALVAPMETAEPPRHLVISLLLERSLLACLSADQQALVPLHERLVALEATGEAALVAGLRSDLMGNRRLAVTRFNEAAERAQVHQPPVRALALVTGAQLLDELGDQDLAVELIDRAASITEARRNAVPFLGWTRHGSRVCNLLERQAGLCPTPWVLDLRSAISGTSGIATHLSPSTALARERVSLPEGTMRPSLSARERDVLFELARGSTYADIATNLFVSENTVKTHVSSLYAKLSVNRRSAALAAARNMNLL